MSDPVVTAILDATPSPRLREAMLLGSRLESTWSPTAAGDGGTSFGPFQIHLPAHPGVTQAEAERPSWAARFMLPAYRAALAQVPGKLWGTDPEKAAETTAYLAERPAATYYASRGVHAVNSAWHATQEAMRGQPITGGGGGGGGKVQTTAAWYEPWTWGQGIQALDRTLVRLAVLGPLVAVGAAMIGAGLYLAAGKPRSPVQVIQQQAAPLASTAAAAA